MEDKTLLERVQNYDMNIIDRKHQELHAAYEQLPRLLKRLSEHSGIAEQMLVRMAHETAVFREMPTYEVLRILDGAFITKARLEGTLK